MHVALLMVALSQTPAPAAMTHNVLTLEQALTTAEKQNLDLAVARARLEQSQLLSRRLWAAYLPNISAGGSYTYNNIEASISLPRGYYIRDVFQPQGPAFDPSRDPGVDNPPGAQTSYILVPSEFVEAPIQRHHQLGARVQLQQALIAPALWPAIQSAYLAEKVADLSVESARRDILFGVVQLYYGAAALREVTEIQERLLESRRAHEKNARIRFDAGAVPRIVLLRAQIDLARTEQDARRARNSYQAAKISLATLLDRDVNFEVAAPPEPQPLPTAPTGDEALARRPDVAAAQTNVELAEKQRTATWFKFLPNLGLTAQYQWANVTGFTGRNDSWSVGLGLNWVLWDGGLREVELRETASKVNEALANQRNAENKARADVDKALLELESARANALKAQEQLKLARENAQLVDVNFQAGAATYLDVSDANTALLGAELSSLTERLNAQLAQLTVAKAAGLFAAR